MKHLIIFPILFLLSFAAAAQAEIYTWTDDQGTVTFTDNPNRIPARYSGDRKSGEIISIKIVKPQKVLRLQRNTKLKATVPGNRVKSVAAARAEQQALPLGDQPKASRLSEQPKAAPLGEQPEATPLSEQPEATPLSDQPKAAPLGDQPEATPLTEQPEATPLTDQPETKR